MDIKRINDTTIKFVLTEEELQARGIQQDEILYDKEKGEKLFVEMMEEAYQQIKFEPDGPLWIEAHMYDKSVEIIVTKGKHNTSLKLSKAGDPNHPALEKDKGGRQYTMNHEMYSSQLENRSIVSDNVTNQKTYVIHSSIYKFKDIENIIQLAHRLPFPFFNSQLFLYNNRYYVVVMYPEQQRLIRGKEWLESLVLEYGERAHTTIHRLEEYGKEIIKENAFLTIKEHFRQL